jgi:hypothetical protein
MVKGLALAGIGCHFQMLPLVYLGYSVLGGAGTIESLPCCLGSSQVRLTTGWGLGYISPIPALLSWFPDRRGLAAGMGLSAFGGGAMLAAPLESWLLKQYFQIPTYLGPADTVNLSTIDGHRFASLADGSLAEVLIAASGDIARLPVKISEGVYLLGSGSTGADLTFLTLAGGYFCTMAAGALLLRIPPKGWLPKGFVPSTSASITQRSVHYSVAMKTPQFYLMWLTLFGNAIGG